MKENKLEVIIGAVVLAVALGFIVFVYQTTSLSLSNSKHYNLIEGCGGFFSPIAKGKLSSDLAVELNLPVILVVKNILGCINHTLMSLKSIENLNLVQLQGLKIIYLLL